VGAQAFGEGAKQVFLGRDFSREHSFSQETYEAIDAEVRKIVTESLEKARRILREDEAMLNRIADALKTHETISRDELLKLIDGKELPPPTVAVIESAVSAPDDAQGSDDSGGGDSGSDDSGSGDSGDDDSGDDEAASSTA